MSSLVPRPFPVLTKSPGNEVGECRIHNWNRWPAFGFFLRSDTLENYNETIDNHALTRIGHK